MINDFYDDDRIYFFDPSQVVRVVDEDERVTTEILPTDSPDKFIVRITAPVPKFYIKRAVMVK